MRILISNDDGYQADGIIQLANSLSEIAEVIVVAPSENKSAASSSLTIGKPLKPIQIKKMFMPLMQLRVIVFILLYVGLSRSQLT